MPSLWDYLPGSRRPNPFDPFSSRVTYYAPGPGGRMEGGFETSQPNPGTGRRVPSTLDDVRLGVSPFVTLAGDPSRYGQTVKMGPLTYTSPIDQKSYTLPDVTGYVHDTGSAFRGRPDKLDVAAGDYRGYSPQAASAAVQADAGRRTVTPLEGDEADRALRPIGMPEAWRATGEGESPTETAMASGPPQQRQKTMPNSLIDMFNSRDPAGEPSSFADNLQARSNSLIGLGLGLLQPSNPLRGQSSWGNALEGFQAGAGLDARTAALAADRRQHAGDRAQAQANFERTFTENQMTEAEKLARAAGFARGTPEHTAFIQKAIQSKTEGDWKVVEVPHPDYPDQKIPIWANVRTRETAAFVPGQGAPGTTGVATSPDVFTKGTAPVYGQGGGADYAASPAAALPPSGGGVPTTAPAAAGRAFPPPKPGMNSKVYAEEMTKRAVKDQAEEERAKKQAGMIDPVKEDIDQAIKIIQANPKSTTGLYGSLASKFGGQAGDLAGMLQTAKARVSFDELQKMRQASPTGGALGNVSDKDMAALQAVQGSLEQSRTPEQLLYNLDRVQRMRHEIIHGPGTAPPPRFAPPDAAASSRKTGGGETGYARSVRELKKNPAMRDDFDERYGPGAAMRELTGK